MHYSLKLTTNLRTIFIIFNVIFYHLYDNYIYVYKYIQILYLRIYIQYLMYLN